jgi:hypothetical protein
MKNACHVQQEETTLARDAHGLKSGPVVMIIANLEKIGSKNLTKSKPPVVITKSVWATGD